MRLVYKSTQKEVKKGDGHVIRGDVLVVAGWEKPRHPGSTGRVYVREESGKMSREYYPSVIGAEWIEREDRA